MPEKFIARLQKLISDPIRYEQVCQSFTAAKPVTIRVNTLKADSTSIISELAAAGIATQPVSWYPQALILPHTTTRQITELPAYIEGRIYIQSLSSMIPVLVLDPQPEEKVLDLAAAPGSKTTQIAAHMQNTGDIVANDSSHQRLYKLRANLTQQGVTNTKVTNFAGQSMWQKYPEYFDKVLVDAPCSMEGRFNTQDPSTYEDWSEGKVKRLARLQQWLLRSAVSATTVDGTIVYSTCTLSPEENEGVINWIFEKEQGKIELEAIGVKGLEVTSILAKTLRIYPSETMEGFFIAKIKKVKSNVI